MSWIQQNWPTVVLVVVVTAFLFRAPILARVYQVGTITPHDLKARLAENPPPLLLDVRTPEEFQLVHILQAELAPLQDLSRLLPGLNEKYPGRTVAVICRSGSRSLLGSIQLKQAGFADVRNVEGGILHWEEQGYPVVRLAPPQGGPSRQASP